MCATVLLNPEFPSTPTVHTSDLHVEHMAAFLFSVSVTIADSKESNYKWHC